MAKGIEKELTAITKVKRDEGEDDQSYFTRLAEAVKKLPDSDWDRLSEPTQLWANSAQIAVEKKAAVPNFDGEVPAEKTGKKAAPAKEAKAAPSKKGAKAEKVEKAPAKTAKAAKADKAEKEAPAKKEAKGAKSAKKAKADDSAGRGRKGSWPLTAKIKVVAKENPHRSGTKNYKRFEKYKNGMTVEDAIAAGAEWANMRYLSNLGHLEIG